jgi:hypothetical protein
MEAEGLQSLGVEMSRGSGGLLGIWHFDRLGEAGVLFPPG